MKRTLEFVIDCGQENMDVRTFVRRYLGFSARILTALKYEGEMLKNGESVHSNAVLKAGDTLTLTNGAGNYGYFVAGSFKSRATDVEAIIPASYAVSDCGASVYHFLAYTAA